MFYFLSSQEKKIYPRSNVTTVKRKISIYFILAWIPVLLLDKHEKSGESLDTLKFIIGHLKWPTFPPSGFLFTWIYHKYVPTQRKGQLPPGCNQKPVQMLKRTSPPTFWSQLANYPLDSTVQTCLDERPPNKREDHNQNNWHYYLLVTSTCLGNSKEAEIHTMVRVLKPASIRILSTFMLTRNLPAKQLFLSPFQTN